MTNTLILTETMHPLPTGYSMWGITHVSFIVDWPLTSAIWPPSLNNPGSVYSPWQTFPFTIGSPLQVRHWWTAKTNQHAYTTQHGKTHQPAFVNIIRPDIEECRLVRFRHVGAFCMQVESFSVRLHGFSKCWIFGHMAFHTRATILSRGSYSWWKPHRDIIFV